MFRSIKLVLINAICLAAPVVQADQNDPRLDDLFPLLRQTENPRLLAEIENQIWTIWYQAPEDSGEVPMSMGLRFMELGAYAQALESFSSLIEAQPEFAEAWNRRATLYYLMGDYAASIADIERTLTLEPRHFGALSGLGLVYLQLNNLERARQAFEDMLEVHPNSQAGRENLVRVMDALRGQFI